MSLGEIPGGNLRAYYKLENVNDSSGNGFTLTNNNSVGFAQGKFTNGADFGSSGTNKGLTRATLILSSKTPSVLSVSFWWKLNSTADTAVRLFFSINTDVSTAAGGELFQVRYSITGGVMNIEVRNGNTSVASINVTPDTNWHFIRCVRTSDNANRFIMSYDTIATAVANKASFSGATAGNAFGNGPGLTTQLLGMMDQIIISESLYTEDNTTGRSNRYKYYTQAKGRFAI
jgi:hypothetical protein